MKIIESLLTKNKCMTSSKKKFTPKGLMLHSVGCAQPNASVFVKNWNNGTVTKCVHAFIDANTGDIYHTLPWNYRGWHAGAGANSTHIGCEMCESNYIKYAGGATFTILDAEKARKHATTAYNSAVELYAWLCKEYHLDPLKDIISHKEGHALGIASNHGDPEHYWSQLGLPYTMNGFRHDVSEAMGNPTNMTNDKLPKKIEISVDDLNIRVGPGTNYKKTGKYTGKGTFTIVETQNGLGSTKGWGLLSDYSAGRNGWISLDYAKDAAEDLPKKVKVSIDDLNIRVGPGTNYDKTGKCTGVGTFTIVEIQNGSGSTKGWGLLKSYAAERNGWISLDYATGI